MSVPCSILVDFHDDILSTIFLHCLPDDPLQIALSPTEAPLLLTHICQRWRTLAYHQPRLWEWLTLNQKCAAAGSDSEQLDSQQEADAKDAWIQWILGLSKGVPFKLQINNLSPARGTVRITPLHILSGLCTTTMTRLSLRGVSSQSFAPLTSTSFPALEYLVLALQNEGMGTTLNIFENCPRLRRAAIYNYHTTLPVTYGVKLPWAQLTHLAYHLTSNQKHFFEMCLPLCSRLEWLSLSLTFDQSSTPVPCTLATIRSLAIDFTAGSWTIFFPHFFRYFSFPKLRSLALKADTFSSARALSDSFSAEELQDFQSKLQTEFTLLTHLTFSLRVLEHERMADLDWILQCTSRLESIDIQLENLAQYGRTLKRLYETNFSILPNLNTLFLDIRCLYEPVLTTLTDYFKRQSPLADQSSPGPRLERLVAYNVGRPLSGNFPKFLETITTLNPDLKAETREWRGIYGHWLDKDPEVEDWRESVLTPRKWWV